MTYIKWKDEVESYLVNLPQEEKQKLFSYFSEMYADKRDAGKSEAQIIEEFGAPYDVAKRILDGNKESAETPEETVKVSGGSNYNYNYYNYNYGGAPQPPPPAPAASAAQRAAYAQPSANQPAFNQPAAQPQSAPLPNGVPNSYIAPQAEKKTERSAGQIIVIIILIALNVGLAITAGVGMAQGWVAVGTALGAAAAGKATAGAVLSEMGMGLLNVGVNFMLLAGVSALGGLIKKKIKAYKGKEK